MVTLAGSGLRVGELLGLEVADVDFPRRTISVERQRMQRGHIGALKSKSLRRVVPVGQVVIDELAAHLAAFPSDGPLFVNEVGEPLAYRRWRTLWEAAARQAGVDLTPHGLRHFFASALISGGASVKQVQAVLGPRVRGHHVADLLAPVAWRRGPHARRHGRGSEPVADSLRTARASDG